MLASVILICSQPILGGPMVTGNGFTRSSTLAIVPFLMAIGFILQGLNVEDDLLAAVEARGYQILEARTLNAVRGKRRAADALKAMTIAYLRFGTANPAHYRLMFGPTLQGHDGALPCELQKRCVERY